MRRDRISKSLAAAFATAAPIYVLTAAAPGVAQTVDDSSSAQEVTPVPMPDEAVDDPSATTEVTPVPTGDAVVADIVVTAQRRAQRLQDVPIAITAITGQDLVKTGVVDLADIAAAVPGLAITGFAGVNASNLVSIRGVSGQLAPIGASQATAIYLDGVYLAIPDAAFFGLNDVERIEVLRGPQGTLYGRNATAGAINIITRTPGNTLTGGANVSYGNFDEVLARGDISGPLGGGFSAGLAASYQRRDGFFLNTTTGNRIGKRRSYTTRGKLRYDNGPFEAILSGDWSEIKGPDIFKNGLQGGVFVGLGDPDIVTNNEESRIFGKTKIGGVSLVVNYEVSDRLLLTSISAWRTVSRKDGYDIDGSDLLSLYVDSAHAADTLNQELRAVYSGKRINFTVGANWYREDGWFGFIVNPPDRNDPRAHLSPYDTTKLDALAAFGQVDFRLTDMITLLAGLRLNYETRDFTVDYSNAPTPGNFVEGKVSDTALLPMVGINFQPTSDLLFYAKYSQGYQAPGFGFVPGPTAPANIFFAETLHAYEAGIKSQFLDRRVTFNAAAFYYDYQDLQVRTQIREGQVGISNAASASIKGAEAELQIRPVNNLTLRGHVTYLDAVYDSFCETVTLAAPLLGDPTCIPPGGSAPTGADRAGNRLNNAPKWSGGIGADYTHPFGSSTLNFNVTYLFETSSFFHAANGIGRNLGWHRLDARIGLRLLNGVEFFAYGRNLTDDRYCAFCLQQSNVVLSQSISDPRTYGVGVGYRF